MSPLLTKSIIHLCRKWNRILKADEEREPSTNLQDGTHNFGRLIYHKVTTFNLFQRTLTDVQHGIYSTRVYIILLLTGVYILVLYSTSTVGSQQIIVQNPSKDQVEDLNKLYFSSLSCPCRRSSMPRSTFMHHEIRLHPFCTSSFVRDDHWLQYWTMKFLNGTIDPTPPFYWADVRKHGLKFFHYVKILCDLAATAVSDALNAFQTEQFFSSQPISQLEFNDLTSNWDSYLFIQVTYDVKDDLKTCFSTH
ncbi:unnamed protein product [Rotaria sp. Silwood2]|nr:unnamed protein product [Rotaria sp. Silwood2]